MKKLVLASASPRRQEILRQLGVQFQVTQSNADETFPEGCMPGQAAMLLALKKVRDVIETIDYPAIVIGADTVVVLGGEIMGKPADSRQAIEMISKLAGKEHKVITGIAAADNTNGTQLTDYQTTMVRMKNISPDRIHKYVATGEPFDKAGAYAIQGKASVFVDSIDGCYFNVVGLPVAKLDGMLCSMGMDLFE